MDKDLVINFLNIAYYNTPNFDIFERKSTNNNATISSPMNHMYHAIPIRVECYSGNKADEEPVRFSLHDMNFEIREIIDRWYQADTNAEFPPARYFKVEASDGKHYMLKHLLDQDQWYLWVKGETVHL